MNTAKTLLQARISTAVAEDFENYVNRNLLRRAAVVEDAIAKYLADKSSRGKRGHDSGAGGATGGGHTDTNGGQD